MDLKMEVYTPGLELLGLLEVYTSVLWEEYAFKAGSFSLDAPLTDSNRELLRPGNLLWMEGETAGMVEHIEQSAGEDGLRLAVKGRLLCGLLDWRVLWGRYQMQGEVPALMYHLVEDCAINPTRGDTAARVIPGLALDGAPPATGASIRKQQTGGPLLEALEELGEGYGVAFGVKFDPQAPQMLFWARPGIDRTVNQGAVDPVFYSTELDDVLSAEYTYDDSDRRTVALVAGEGEGASRVYTTVGGSDAGMSRRELFVDARDLQSSDGETTMTAAEYLELLENRGRERLGEHPLVESFDASIRTVSPTYVYGVDFLLGDTITVTDDRLGVTVDAVVYGVTRSAGREGETLSLTLGYAQPTVGDILRRKAVK